MEIQQVFSKEHGEAKNYRIPAMIVTKKGTIVAAADARLFGGGDNPNRIDKVVRRSLDNGKTWGEMITSHRECGESKMAASAAIDPALLYDKETDTIFMLYSHTPAGVGIFTCDKTTGEDKNGNKIIYGADKSQYVLEGNELKKDGVASGYIMDKSGNVTKDGKNFGNIYIRDGQFSEPQTAYLTICQSNDDGLTWSEPRSLNSVIKEKYMGFINAGPGVGIKVQKGKYKGRLIFPIYYNTAGKGILMLSCCMMFSDDGGKTWQRGKSPNQTRWNGIFKVCHRFVMPHEMLTESQVIELPDGVLRLFMRNHSLRKLVAMAESYDGGETWKNFRYNKQLVQCICQLSVINIDYYGKPATVFLNAADKTKRRNGTIRLSFDYGETFESSAVIAPNEFVYSSMAQMADGKIGVLFEGSTQHETIDFMAIEPSWIADNSVEKAKK